jgi:hypothetical protein
MMELPVRVVAAVVESAAVASASLFVDLLEQAAIMMVVAAARVKKIGFMSLKIL